MVSLCHIETILNYITEDLFCFLCNIRKTQTLLLKQYAHIYSISAHLIHVFGQVNYSGICQIHLHRVAIPTLNNIKDTPFMMMMILNLFQFSLFISIVNWMSDVPYYLQTYILQRCTQFYSTNMSGALGFMSLPTVRVRQGAGLQHCHTAKTN